MPQRQPGDKLSKHVWQQADLPGVHCPAYSGGSALALMFVRLIHLLLRGPSQTDSSIQNITVFNSVFVK